METTTITLPKNLYKSVEEIAREGFRTKEEFIGDALNSFLLSKIWEYRNEMQPFEQKYSMEFEEVKRKVEKSKKEYFEEWDDLIIWEGLYKGYNLWKKRYEGIKGA